MKDAWKQLKELHEQYTREWEVRPDLAVTALGTDRGVRLGVRYHAGNPRELDMPKWHFRSGNVETMRELAQALLTACDFVDKANPEWSAA